MNGATAKPSAGLHILVADDIVVNQRIAVRLLKLMGHTGVLVSDGEQVLRALEQHRFDLVLMDASMPTMDGLSALQAMREAERRGQAHIPVIMVSGHALPEDQHRFREAGADGFVSKPVLLEDLRSEIERVTGHRSAVTPARS